MKLEQEQIEEMAKQMCGAIDNSCIHDCTPACGAREYAKRCFKAGYRKASKVIDEFVERIMTDAEAFLSNMSRNIIRICASKMKKEISYEMRKEMEK